MKKYIITILVLFFLIILAVGGYFVYGNFKTNESNSTDTLISKATSEIEYLSSNIINIMNEINNISYSNYKIVNEEIEASGASSDTESEQSSNQGSGQNSEQTNSTTQENTINTSSMVSDNILSSRGQDVNWDEINSKVQELYSSWTTIMMDLTSLNVNKDNLLKFNQTLDSITKNVEDKNKSEALINSASLYNLISSYIGDFSNDTEKNSVLNVRSNILYSYAYTESGDWAKVSEYIGKAKQDFSNLLNNQINNINKIDVINKAYILLNELEQDCNNQDKNVFLVNYSNLMQELQNI